MRPVAAGLGVAFLVDHPRCAEYRRARKKQCPINCTALTAVDVPVWVPANGYEVNLTGCALTATSVALILRRHLLAAVTSSEQVSVLPLLTLLDAPDFTRLATGNPKSGPALPPGSGGSRGDARRHPFPSP